MTLVESFFLYSALFLCLTLSVTSFLPKGLTERVYLALTLTALVFEGAAISIRWSNTGHPPLFGTFEEALAASWTILIFSVVLDRRGRFSHLAIPFAAITLLYGLNFNTEAKPLTISEMSLWVDFHVLFAWVAYGFYTFSFICALGILFNRAWAGDAGQRLYGWLLWGFLAQTIMFVLGSYYSVLLHGRWWVWDSVEYLFIVSWFLYAIPIHGKILYGWGDRRLAWFIVLAMAATIVLYWGLIYVPWTTYHVFDIEFVIHG